MMMIPLQISALKKPLLLAGILLASSASHAIKLGSWDSGKIINLPNFTGGTANVTSYDEFCVSPAAPYRLKIRNSTGPANAAFSLVSGALPPLPIKFEFQDLLNPGYETLVPDQYTALNKTGSKCTGGPGGLDNAAILITIANADLAAASPGIYSRVFLVTANDGGAGANSTRTVNLTINFNIPSLMKISGLNDIIFPPFDAINPLIGSDDFCVYRNGAGNYSVTAQGSGAAGAFTLTDGTTPLPYSATWNDSATTTTLVAGTPLTNRTNVFTANVDCNTGTSNNAAVELTIQAADVNAVPVSTYTGTLTLIISPL